MYDRFPELRSIPEGTPPRDGFLDGLFFLGGLCGIVYIIPFIALILYLCGQLFAARLLAWFAIICSVLGPAIWAFLVPGGVWYLLLPVLSPVVIVSVMLVRACKGQVERQAMESSEGGLRRPPLKSRPGRQAQAPHISAER
ncbi:MAG: hypothetical protein ACON3Z_18255 [Bradymonadia bacterium]